MLGDLFIVFLTVAILLGLIALADSFLKPWWGESYSSPKALLLVISFVSLWYQLAFLVQCMPLLTILDTAAILACVIFSRRIGKQFLEYLKGAGPPAILVFFLGYLFFLSIFSVPGWNWDSMIYHLSRPFLFLNEGTLFPLHYADIRQASWPAGGDILLYLFTRHGTTFGTGFIEYLFYAGILVALYQYILPRAEKKTAVTAIFIAASMPLMVYCATSEKSDTQPAFAFLLMWLLYDDFRKTRRKTDILLICLALAFGISCKVSFLILGPLSLAIFALLEMFERKREPLTGPKIPLPLLLLFLLVFLFLAQTHTCLFNLLARGDLVGDAEFHSAFGNVEEGGFIYFFQNLSKYLLSLADFVFPLSLKGIPFIDTFLSFLYNKTIGALTHDTLWEYHYFPEEMRASFGPFGLWIGAITVVSLFRKRGPFLKAFSLLTLVWLFYISFKIPWQPVSAIRYLLPTMITGLAFFTPLHSASLIFRHPLLTRGACLVLLAFANVANYAKPLVAYDAKAIPWYSYAFTDRRYLYANKYFLDARMEIFEKEALPGKNILIFAFLSEWSFPYYDVGGKARIRLDHYKYRRGFWGNLEGFNLIVCSDTDCMAEMNARGEFEKIWENKPANPKKGAFYKRLR